MRQSDPLESELRKQYRAMYEMADYTISIIALAIVYLAVRVVADFDSVITALMVVLIVSATPWVAKLLKAGSYFIAAFLLMLHVSRLIDNMLRHILELIGAPPVRRGIFQLPIFAQIASLHHMQSLAAGTNGCCTKSPCPLVANNQDCDCSPFALRCEICGACLTHCPHNDQAAYPAFMKAVGRMDTAIRAYDRVTGAYFPLRPLLPEPKIRPSTPSDISSLLAVMALVGGLDEAVMPHTDRLQAHGSPNQRRYDVASAGWPTALQMRLISQLSEMTSGELAPLGFGTNGCCGACRPDKPCICCDCGGDKQCSICGGCHLHCSHSMTALDQYIHRPPYAGSSKEYL